jgi:hypothetical protein
MMAAISALISFSDLGGFGFAFRLFNKKSVAVDSEVKLVNDNTTIEMAIAHISLPILTLLDIHVTALNLNIELPPLQNLPCVQGTDDKHKLADDFRHNPS